MMPGVTARMRTIASALLPSGAFIAALALAGCRTEQTLVAPDPHLERMLDQPKTRAYEAAPLLPDDTAMQTPPDGVMPFREAAPQPPVVRTGVDRAQDEDTEVDGTPRIPITVDHALLQTGRDRFDVFCAACHGVLGDGASPVAEMMNLRKPPDLVAKDRIPGSTFRTIHRGYGMMPSYAVQLSVRDTWAVVAYLEALRLSRNAHVGDLPPEVRQQLAKEAP
jgi:mono/diheme cytochrome c family protein